MAAGSASAEKTKIAAVMGRASHSAVLLLLLLRSPRRPRRDKKNEERVS